jgi:succinyl-CoA synthetase beta subunit
MLFSKLRAPLLYARIVKDRTVEQSIASAAAAAPSALSEIDAKHLLNAIGVAVAIPQVAATADEAVSAATRLGFPVVLKVLSPQVSHKSDVGGVELGLTSADAVRAAFTRIRDNLATRGPGARFDGVAVDRMAKPGVELILGVIRDPRFGPLVVAGLGGVFVEALADTVFRLAPLDRREARGMLDDLRGAAILRGVRGAPPIAFDAVADLLVKLGDFAAAYPAVSEMDLNPGGLSGRARGARRARAGRAEHALSVSRSA